MASFNRVILMGNVTRQIELKYLQSGTAVTELGMAVNERRKSQTGEWIEEVVFVDVTLWGRTAEIAGEYLTKGSPVFIEGRLKYDTWEADGQKRSKLRVVGDRLVLLGGRGGGGGPSGGQGGGASRDFDESEYSRSGGDFGGGPPSSGAQHSAGGHSAGGHSAGGQPSGGSQFSNEGRSGGYSGGNRPSSGGAQSRRPSGGQAPPPPDDIPF